MKLIERTSYLDRLKRVQGTPDIKVITGIRRCGKSKLMEAFVTYLQSLESNVNIIHINFNLSEYKSLRTADKLEQYVLGQYKQGQENVLCIDEVQLCSDFESAINSLHARECFDIYLTGSNAFLLSSDLATLFTGRTMEIKVYPFSFAEFIQYFDSSDIQQSFDDYVMQGGMAGSYLYSDIEDKYKYIADVYDTLILRDIRQKYNLRNYYLMDCLSDYMLDNVSNLTSVRNVANALCSAQLATNGKTVGSYIQYLCLAFAFYKMRRFDIRGKKYIASQDKYYLADHAFRFAKLGTKNLDYGRIYENIVAIELQRRGYEVYVGTLYQKEIDFVAMRGNEKIFIQVSDDLSNPETFKREYTPLLQIKEAYPKMIIARTRHADYDYQGIVIKDIAHWLREG
ncbi:MAG: ATP-binding protein [Paludibacteraceae bacterium]|nr:ATP-binding protein [Paludibacteraceae bacterium]